MASPATPRTSTIRCGAPTARRRCSSTRTRSGRLSELGQQWSAGQLKYAKDFTWFLCPYINSYKRFQSGTFAPTKIMWSEDNRTAGFRLCGKGTKGIRMECRIGGADLNPYLAFAALIAAGLAGIDEKLSLQEPFVGDAYQASRLPKFPRPCARRPKRSQSRKC
jgi:glutamine synthetase